MKTIKWYNIIFLTIFMINIIYVIENIIVLSTTAKTLTPLGITIIGLSLISVILTGDWLIDEYKASNLNIHSLIKGRK